MNHCFQWLPVWLSLFHPSLLPHAEFAENLSIFDYFHKRNGNIGSEQRKEEDPSTKLEKQYTISTEQRKDDQEETSIELKWAMQIAEGILQSVGKDQYQMHTFLYWWPCSFSMMFTTLQGCSISIRGTLFTETWSQVMVCLDLDFINPFTTMTVKPIMRLWVVMSLLAMSLRSSLMSRCG